MARPSEIATDLVDLDVTFRGRATETASGAPPLRFGQIAFEATVAITGRIPGDAPSARTNVAKVGYAVRPLNLTSGS